MREFIGLFKKVAFLFVCYFFIIPYSWAGDENRIQLINRKVDDIVRNRHQLDHFEITIHSIETESTPPIARFFYTQKDENLLIFQIDVGHEIFLNRFTYYFDNNILIKYLKESFNHPDAPPKEAIIYSHNGLILWKNTSEPLLNGHQIQSLFRLNIDALKSFAKY